MKEKTILVVKDLDISFRTNAGVIHAIRGVSMDLQKVNTAIWSEWLPALREYTLAGNWSLEIYMPPAEKPEDTLSYICVPLKKADP